MLWDLEINFSWGPSVYEGQSGAHSQGPIRTLARSRAVRYTLRTTGAAGAKTFSDSGEGEQSPYLSALSRSISLGNWASRFACRLSCGKLFGDRETEMAGMHCPWTDDSWRGQRWGFCEFGSSWYKWRLLSRRLYVHRPLFFRLTSYLCTHVCLHPRMPLVVLLDLPYGRHLLATSPRPATWYHDGVHDRLPWVFAQFCPSGRSRTHLIPACQRCTAGAWLASLGPGEGPGKLWSFDAFTDSASRWFASEALSIRCGQETGRNILQWCRSPCRWWMGRTKK